MSIAVLAAFALLCAGFAVDCARMCMMGRNMGMHMDCWLARNFGLACDTGTLILLILLTMITAASALYIWSLSFRRT